MYARFIPPSAAKPLSKIRHESVAPTLERPAVMAEVKGAGFGYSRYVPGARTSDLAPQTQAPAPTIHRFDDEPSAPWPKRQRSEEDETGARELDQKGGVKKRKKSKKDKKSKDEGSLKTLADEETERQTEEAVQEEDIEIPDAEADGHQDTAAEPDKPEEKRGEKRKKKKKETQPEEEALVQDDQRHKAVLERKLRSLQFAEAAKDKAQPQEAEEPSESHGLEPLPQPAPAPVSTEKPRYDILPAWLSAPIRVSHDTRASFTDVGILPRPARLLKEKGYAEAFAVQTAALPLLLPNNKERPGDLLVSAATGSGKTLAYALPIARDLSHGVVTRLRALVVLPTRELVKQAQEVFELCARVYEGEERKRVRIGVAVGSQSLASEQQVLMGGETRYDPETYKRLLEEQKQQQDDTPGETEHVRLGAWEGQVVDLQSRVDVLICTPGRLVEHMEQTPGFSLDYVRWLVVDEADKLLAQSFQGWLDVVLERFRAAAPFGARDFPDMPYAGVRKVILSATLTRDLSLLDQLALRRPRLIVLEGDGDGDGAEEAGGVSEHTLPSSLREVAVRVHDANLKPLYLVDLLRGEQVAMDGDQEEQKEGDGEKKVPMALIFTKSNESALRLSRLLTILDPSLERHLSTLTSNTPTRVRRKTLASFSSPSSPLRLVIASDLVARGIDIPLLPHVINYDLPPSVAGYVHRVGRTARAGRPGCAWTLVGDAESGWFWGKIAKGAGVKRAAKVERGRIGEMSEERVGEYEDALARLGREVMEPWKR